MDIQKQEEEDAEEIQSSSSSSENENGKYSNENENENERDSNSTREEQREQNVLRFLDSMDNYLVHMDSLSSTLRQGWLELASARQSMGVLRINSAFFDLKYHSAATTLQLNNHDEELHFTLCKWTLPGCCSEEAKYDEDELSQRKYSSPQLRHRGTTQYSELQEKISENNGSPVTVDNQVQKERSKTLSMFGTLVSPKLRAAQLSFETALETLVEIANIRSAMLCTYDRVRKEMESNMA